MYVWWGMVALQLQSLCHNCAGTNYVIADNGKLSWLTRTKLRTHCQWDPRLWSQRNRSSRGNRRGVGEGGASRWARQRNPSSNTGGNNALYALGYLLRENWFKLQANIFFIDAHKILIFTTFHLTLSSLRPSYLMSPNAAPGQIPYLGTRLIRAKIQINILAKWCWEYYLHVLRNGDLQTILTCKRLVD